MTNEKRNDVNRNRQEAAEPMKRTSRRLLRKRPVQEEKSATTERKWVQIRLLPIWLRIVLVLVLLIGAAIFGMMIGYGFIGDGEARDVFKKETWVHILDIMNGKEL